MISSPMYPPTSSIRSRVLTASSTISAPNLLLPLSGNNRPSLSAMRLVLPLIGALERHARQPVIVLLLLVSTVSQAQDYKRMYRHARDLFDEQKYSLAMKAFRPLIVYDRNNPYAEYSTFYCGVSALQLGYHTLGRDMLLQL